MHCHTNPEPHQEATRCPLLYLKRTHEILQYPLSCPRKHLCGNVTPTTCDVVVMAGDGFVVIVALEPRPLRSLGLDERFTRIDYTAK